MSDVPSARSHPLHFAAFIINTTADSVSGNWRPALPRQANFDDLERWVRLARTLERGKFDAVSFAGAAGLQARRSRDEGGYAEGSFRTPSSDASVLAGAVAYVTQHLGIAFTASVVQEDPLSFARRISNLDHASKGRIAWNVADDPPGAWTEEYVDVTYKLWEGSWDEDALRPDGRDGKVHRINHLVNTGRSPAPYEEFVDHVAPVLQGRGLMQREYADGSLRHKLFGRGDRVSERHPAARYRGAFAPQHV